MKKTHIADHAEVYAAMELEKNVLALCGRMINPKNTSVSRSTCKVCQEKREEMRQRAENLRLKW